MSLKNKLIVSLAIIACSASAFAVPSPDAMRAASAANLNTRLAQSITVTKDPNDNIISYHINGVDPSDAEILLRRDPSSLSTEFTVINGTTKEGGTCCYMLPTNVATSQVVESLSKDLVNAGAINLQISKQRTGRQ